MLDYELSQRAADAAAAREIEKAKATGTGGDSDNFSVAGSMYTMPIKQADFSGAKEQEKAIETLGYTKNSRGNYVPTGKVKIKYSSDGVTNFRRGNSMMSGDTEYERSNKEMEVSVFNKDGKVKTRKEFVAQAGNDKNAQKALNNYFDKMLEAGKTIGMSGIYTQRQLSDQYNQNRTNSAAGGIDVLPLNYDSSTWNPHSKNYKVREIKEYRGGRPKFGTEQISINTLLNKKDKDKNTLNVSPYWTTVGGQQGLLLTTVEDGEDHSYFVPADEMPDTNISMAKEAFEAADAAHRKGNTAREKRLREAGFRALHLGFTLDNKPANQSPVQFATIAQQLKGE